MKSIEKLREYAQSMRKQSVTPGHNPCADEVDDYLDEIEAEIAERYMELPLDAGGVPIRIGDKMLCLSDGWTFDADSIEIDKYGVYVRANGKSRIPTSNCAHHRPRTLEDVLIDLVMKTTDINVRDLGDDIPDALDALIGEYADEIRKVVGE